MWALSIYRDPSYDPLGNGHGMVWVITGCRCPRRSYTLRNLESCLVGLCSWAGLVGHTYNTNYISLHIDTACTIFNTQDFSMSLDN